MLLKIISILIICFLSIFNDGFGQNITLKNDSIIVEYEYQNIKNYDEEFNKIKQINFSERRLKQLKERIEIMKKNQQQGIISDTSKYTTLKYSGKPEKITLIEEKIIKDKSSFKNVIASKDCIIRTKDITELTKFERSEQIKEIEIQWVDRNKSSKIKLDLSYSNIEILSEFDLELIEIYTEGRDEHGLPIPKERKIKQLDKIIIKHYNW